MPVLRSRGADPGRGRPAAGCGFAIARENFSYAASDRSFSSRCGRPAHAAHAIAITSTTPEGASHNKMSIPVSVGTPGGCSGEARRPPRVRDLGSADPLVGAVDEPLVLPDRHGVLQLVDEGTAGVEGL